MVLGSPILGELLHFELSPLSAAELASPLAPPDSRTGVVRPNLRVTTPVLPKGTAAFVDDDAISFDGQLGD